MRLIDADELRKAFKKSLFFTDVHLHYAREIIDNAPTVAERPTGHWVWTSYNPYDENIGRWNCSICNYEPDDENSHYCPNCGAYMREDEE